MRWMSQSFSRLRIYYLKIRIMMSCKSWMKRGRICSIFMRGIYNPSKVTPKPTKTSLTFSASSKTANSTPPSKTTTAEPPFTTHAWTTPTGSQSAWSTTSNSTWSPSTTPVTATSATCSGRKASASCSTETHELRRELKKMKKKERKDWGCSMPVRMHLCPWVWRTQRSTCRSWTVIMGRASCTFWSEMGQGSISCTRSVTQSLRGDRLQWLRGSSSW